MFFSRKPYPLGYGNSIEKSLAVLNQFLETQ